MNAAQEKFEAWAIVELFGHQRVAGRLSEQAIGGETFIRVDVPHGDGEYTRLFGKGAIYAINLCSEDVARNAARYISVPLRAYEAKPELPRIADDGDRFDDDEDVPL